MLMNDNKVLRYLAALVSASTKQLRVRDIRVICVLQTFPESISWIAETALPILSTCCHNYIGYIVYSV